MRLKAALLLSGIALLIAGSMVLFVPHHHEVGTAAVLVEARAANPFSSGLSHSSISCTAFGTTWSVQSELGQALDRLCVSADGQKWVVTGFLLLGAGTFAVTLGTLATRRQSPMVSLTG
jgi:hypothetical protein